MCLCIFFSLSFFLFFVLAFKYFLLASALVSTPSRSLSLILDVDPSAPKVLAGLDEHTLRTELGLERLPPSSHGGGGGSGSSGGLAYLRNDSPSVVEGRSDAAHFQSTCQALELVGVAEQAQMELWRLIAAVLHLGEVSAHSPRCRRSHGAKMGSHSSLSLF